MAKTTEKRPILAEAEIKRLQKVERKAIADEKKGLERMRYQAEELSDLAWETVEDILADHDAPGATRLKAVQVVFDRAYGRVREYTEEDEDDQKGTTTTLRLVGAPADG